MKSVTEFTTFALTQGHKTKSALVADGKTPEEIQESLGTTFKMEGDRLKYFINAIDVAGANLENLRRVLVISLNEGENAPSKATKVEELHYVPEFINQAKPAAATNSKGGKGGGRRGGQGGAPKGSPWGLSPEEKAAKNNKGPKPSTPA